MSAPYIKLNTRKKDNPIKSFFSMVFILAMVATGITVIAATNVKKQEPKKYPVSLTIADWGVILDVIDKSNAPHATVVAVNKAIIDQIQAPYQADLKKTQDSLDKLKPKPKQ
jgi:hypothetical protein